MSRYLNERFSTLVPYVPGEQPRNMEFIKLNTNESPFPPSPRAVRAAAEASKRMQLYPDPESRDLNAKLASLFGISPEEVISTDGSDELLNFAVMAYCSPKDPIAFANITYGFYKVTADLNCVPYEEIPLREGFRLDPDDYIGLNETIIIANPNAPTGIALSVSDIEKIVAENPNNIVVVDEAYVDFGAQTCLPLIHKYDNVLITRTFSKSRSMAGARLGWGMANKSIIKDLNTLRNSCNPYNINRMTAAAAIGAIEDEEYTQKCCRTIAETREKFAATLRKMKFEFGDSKANFIFVRHDKITGAELYSVLRERGFLIRHFDTPLLTDYNRITIGSETQMARLAEALAAILKERGEKF